MSFLIGKSSKGNMKRASKFIAPGDLAKTRVYGQKTSRIIENPKVHINARETYLSSKNHEDLYNENHRVGEISGHTLTLHFGKDEVCDDDFTEDSSYLDILKMCSKFIDLNSVGFDITNGDGKKLKNDRDVLALIDEHEFVKNIDIYLDINDAAQPLQFKLPRDNQTPDLVSKIPEVKDVSILGVYKSTATVTVKGDVINGSEEASIVEFFITKENHLSINTDLLAISESMTRKEFQVPKEAEGYYLVAKFTPRSVDGKSGKPRYAITDKYVEDSPSQKEKKVRGKNKNKKVALLNSGEKLEIEFYNNRAVGKNHKSWSRHLGKIVRNKHICPVRVQTWKGITSAEKLHMWDAVKECFSNSKIDLYRESTLEHMCDLWTAWRSTLNKQYVVPCKTKAEAMKNVPEGMNEEDWKWLVVNRFSTDKYQKMSVRNSANRGNGVMPHRTGSQPHRQLIYEMGGKHGNPPDVSSIFKVTRQKKGLFVQPEVEKKYDEIVRIVKTNPSLPPIEVVEKSFGPQKHNHVFTFGGGMKRKHFKDPSTCAYIEDLEVQIRQKDEENAKFKKYFEIMESRIAQLEKDKQDSTDTDTPLT